MDLGGIEDRADSIALEGGTANTPSTNNTSRRAPAGYLWGIGGKGEARHKAPSLSSPLMSCGEVEVPRPIRQER